MLNRNANYQEWLLPYLENGLDEGRRTQLEARLAADPALAAEAERLRRTLNGLRGTAARTPRAENAQVPADLWPHLRARLVLEPAERPRPRAWWAAGLAAPAAAALIVAAFWLPGWHPFTRPEFSSKPAMRQKTAPVIAAPTPSAAPAYAASHQSGAVLRPQVPDTPKAGGPPPATGTAAVRHDPFTPLVSAAPPRKTEAGSSRPIAVSPPAAPPTVQAATPVVRPDPVAPAPPAPALSAQTAADAHRNMSAAGRTALSPPSVTVPQPLASLPAPKPAPALRPLPLPVVKSSEPAGTSAAPAPAKATASVGGASALGGGAAPVAGASPKATVNGLEGAAKVQAKSASSAPSQAPAPVSRQAAPPPPGARRNRISQRPTARAGDAALEAFAANPQAALDAWQTALSAAEQAPLLGENEGEMQANQALMAAQESGMLDDLRARLEARRSQTPQDVVAGRTLAVVLAFGFSREAALRERRRVSALEGATGEDWFALGQAEERAGNVSAARSAYRHALASPNPPSSSHAARARAGS